MLHDGTRTNAHERHGASCGCGHGADHEHARARPAGAIAALAPALACLVCPACLTTYAKALGTVGLGVALSETHHAIFLAVAIVVALVPALLRLRVTRHPGPLVATVAGCALLAAEHAVEGSRALAVAGIAALLLGGAWGHRLGQRQMARRAHHPA